MYIVPPPLPPPCPWTMGWTRWLASDEYSMEWINNSGKAWQCCLGQVNKVNKGNIIGDKSRWWPVPQIWCDEKGTLHMVFFQNTPNPWLTLRKTTNQPTVRDILQNIYKCSSKMPRLSKTRQTVTKQRNLRRRVTEHNLASWFGSQNYKIKDSSVKTNEIQIKIWV